MTPLLEYQTSVVRYESVAKTSNLVSTLTHGHSIGDKVSPTYCSWKAMKQRCLYPKNVQYADYGGRGVTVCDRWLKFENFLADMGERPDGRTLDRIDNDKGYSPDNCRWSSALEQSQNKRRAKHWKYDYATAQTIRARVNSGESRKDVAADTGVSYSQVVKIMLGQRWPSATKERK